MMLNPNPIRNISEWRALKDGRFIIMVGTRMRGAVNAYILLQEAFNKIDDAKNYSGVAYSARPIHLKSKRPAVAVSFTIKFEDERNANQFLSKWTF